MSSGIAVDVSEFQAALKDYVRLSSKQLPAIINGKAKDLMIKAGKETPITTMSPADYEAQIRKNPAIATARANAQYGRGGWTREQRTEIWQKMQKSRLSKGFMRSGFYKAGAKFRVADPARTGAQKVPAILSSDSPSRANIRTATESIMSAVSDVSWLGKSPLDASEKQRIVERGIAKAVPIVTADMRKYIQRKLEANAKKVSATAIRAVGKAFR